MQIQDLLNPEGANLQIREDSDTGVYIAGVTKPEIRTPNECFQMLQKGDENRAVANTNMVFSRFCVFVLFCCSSCVCYCQRSKYLFSFDPRTRYAR